MGPEATAAVLVNYRNWTDTSQCVASLRRTTMPPGYVIVVNNDPRDQPPSDFKAECVEIIEAGGNIGFAAACNLGASRAIEAGAAVLWFLNNDTTVEDGTLPELLMVRARSAADFGACGSLTVFKERPDVVQWAWGRLLPLGAGVRIVGNLPRSKLKDSAARRVTFVPGCSVLLDAELFCELGGFCGEYFMYFEDADLSARLLERGRTLWLVPASIVHHKGGGSGGGIWSPFGAFYYSRNRVWFAKAHGLGVASAVVSAGLQMIWSVKQRLVNSRHIPWRSVIEGLWVGLRTRPVMC